jgi:type II secretory pathway component PulM
LILAALTFFQQAPQPDGTQLALLILGCAVFTVALLVYIFQPTAVHTPEAKTRLTHLYERKEQVYENLRDLNFEYKAGKLSDSDFTSMRDSMEQEAAAILAEVDQLERAALKPYNYRQNKTSNKGARA